MDIKVYRGVSGIDIALIIMFAIMTPLFIVMGLAIWISNQIKTI